MPTQILSHDVRETIVARENRPSIEKSREIFDKRISGVVTTRRICREKPQRNHLEICIDRRENRPRPRRIRHGLLNHEFRNRARALKWSATTETLVQHDTKRVEITTRIDPRRIARELFRRGVRKCAEEFACHRCAAACLGRRRLASLTRRFRDARETEVENARHTFAIHKHVAWLEITMNHTASMRVRHRFRDLAKEFNQLTRRLFVTPHKLIEPRTLDEFHRKPRLTRSRQPRLIEGDDARMPKMSHNLNLALEAKTLLFAGKTPTKQHLHRTRATRRDLLRLIDRALSAAMKFGSKSIASDWPIRIPRRVRIRVATIRLRSRGSRCCDRRNLLKKRPMEKRVVSIKLIDGTRAELARHEM